MHQHHFIISVFDLQLWCPVLESRFAANDILALRAIAGADVDADPNFDWRYHIDIDDLQAISQKFGVSLDLERLNLPESEIWLGRVQNSPREDMPYLIHTGFELPLMLEGRKKLSRFLNIHPTEAEDAFDRWVEKGRLHKEVFLKPVPEHLKPYANESHQVDREIYYTPKGEEWRILAMELLWEAANAGDGWNEHYERLEGMLFGYTNRQNDVWIASINKTTGGIGGMSLCCAVDSEGLAWMESAGLKALPPIGSQEFYVRYYDWDDEAGMKAFLMDNAESVALVRFKLSGKAQMAMFPVTREKPKPFLVRRDQVPEINRHLRRQVDIVLRR